MPEVQKTHRYLLDRQERQLEAAAEAAAAARGAQESAAAEAARREALRQALAAAQAAYDARDYAATVERYTAALAYLPEEPAAVQQLVGQLRQAGYELAVGPQPQAGLPPRRPRPWRRPTACTPRTVTWRRSPPTAS